MIGNGPVQDASGQVIKLVLPVALEDVFNVIGPEFVSATGHHFDVDLMLNPEVPDHILGGADWSIALSNPPYIEKVLRAGRGQGVVLHLGYAPLSFAMRGNSEDAALTSPKEIANFLVRAESIAITSGGTSTAQFAKLTADLGISGKLEPKLRPLPGGGPASAVLEGSAEVALLPLTNIAPVPGLFAAALCPIDMGVQVELAGCIGANANEATKHFADWLFAAGRRDTLVGLGVRFSTEK